MFQNPVILVSRPRPPAISARSETKLWWERRSRFALARRSPKSSLLLALSSGVEAFWSSLGNGRRTQQRPRTASQNRRSWIEETRHLQRSARAYHALRPHCTQAFTQESLQPNGVYNGERAKQRPPPWTYTIYYDDVSSGPRPKAHWYMVTHRCCSDTAPYWTPHRAALSSGPTTMPLQRLSTSYHHVQP